ncbi:MAG: amino acid ABC transporter permease [Verrucomicrobiota bacterium]
MAKKNIFLWFALALVLSTLCYLLYVLISYPYQWEAVKPYRSLFIKGWGATVAISIASLVVSSILGMLLTVGQKHDNVVVRGLSRGYVELVRGTPLLAQLLIGYYVLAPALGLENKILLGVLLLSAFAAAYLCEIFRGGIESVAKSQVDAARAVGFTNRQTYRYVILPQAIKRVVPAVAGQFANLVKDSSLLSVIGIAEFTKQAQDVTAVTYSTYECYLPLAIGYLLITLPLSWWSRRLERQLHFDS